MFKTGSILIIACLAAAQKSSEAAPGANCSCNCVIRKLANYDAKLGLRATKKKELGPKAASATEFVESVAKDGKAVGNGFKCGETMSYVSEAFEGLESQYDEYKHYKNGSAAKYENAIGQKLIDLFKTHVDSPKKIIYHMQHVGLTDHVFAVEQIPSAENHDRGVGYRVYQAYNGVYSLRAWLAKTVTKETIERGDIILNHLTRCTFRDRSDNEPECKATRDSADQLFAALKGTSPAADALANYFENTTVEQAAEDFKPAWRLFGQNQVLEKDFFFDEFLARLANVSEYFNEQTVASTKPMDAKIFGDFTLLHAAPDTVVFPGLPIKTVVQYLATKVEYPSGYGFEVKPVVLEYKSEEEQNAKCRKNAYVLKDSITL